MKKTFLAFLLVFGICAGFSRAQTSPNAIVGCGGNCGGWTNLTISGVALHANVSIVAPTDTQIGIQPVCGNHCAGTPVSGSLGATVYPTTHNDTSGNVFGGTGSSTNMQNAYDASVTTFGTIAGVAAASSLKPQTGKEVSVLSGFASNIAGSSSVLSVKIDYELSDDNGDQSGGFSNVTVTYTTTSGSTVTATIFDSNSSGAWESGTAFTVTWTVPSGVNLNTLSVTFTASGTGEPYSTGGGGNLNLVMPEESTDYSFGPYASGYPVGSTAYYGVNSTMDVYDVHVTL